jgi:hypothetical protein
VHTPDFGSTYSTCITTLYFCCLLEIAVTQVESRMSGLMANSRKGFLLGVVTAESFAKCSLNKLGHSDDVAPVCFYIFIN